MKQDLTTERLLLQPLKETDAAFLFELVNTEGWIRFIGDRNVKTLADAQAYTAKILGSPNLLYWVVSLKADATKIGIVSLIKRDYLEHHDLGFAFLPAHSGKGYAFEAAKTALERLLASGAHKLLLATAISGNTRSIALLEKLGFGFVEEIVVDGEELLVFSTAVSR
jgi:ribosomal-protein-alanine N-acetyltransferase